MSISATTTLFIALSHSEIELYHYIELYNHKELYHWKHYSIVPDRLDYQSLALSSEKEKKIKILKQLQGPAVPFPDPICKQHTVLSCRGLNNTILHPDSTFHQYLPQLPHHFRPDKLDISLHITSEKPSQKNSKFTQRPCFFLTDDN